MFGKPGRGKHRERILEQRTLTAHESIVKDQEVASHAQEIFPGTKRADLIPKVVVKLQQVLKCRKIFFSIVFANILIPMIDLDSKNAWAMQDIQWLTNIGSQRISRKHFSNPRCSAAMGPCNQNWGKFTHIIYHASAPRRSNLLRREPPRNDSIENLCGRLNPAIVPLIKTGQPIPFRLSLSVT